MSIADNWKKITIIALIIFSIIIILIGLLLGMKSLAQFFKFVIIGLLIIFILGGVIYIVWILFFKKNFKDIPYQFKQKLRNITKVMKNDMLGSLYLSGDTKHNRITLGKYFYLRLHLPKIIVEKGKKNTDSDLKSEAIPIDCFIVQKAGILNKMFNEPIFIIVKPEDHNYSAIFNDVTINGFNLTPLDSEFFTIDRRNLDMDIIKGMALNYIRECVYDIFKDLDQLVKQAMNLDQQFQKDKDKSREFEIPHGNVLLGDKK